MTALHDSHRHDRNDQPGGSTDVLLLFGLLNGAIANAHAAHDGRTVDLLLVAKYAAVQHHHRRGDR